jgi:hypothetical protein
VGRPGELALDQKNADAVAWVAAYCTLVVFVCGALVEFDVPPQIVVPIGLFVLPFVACIPSLAWRHRKKWGLFR